MNQTLGQVDQRLQEIKIWLSDHSYTGGLEPEIDKRRRELSAEKRRLEAERKALLINSITDGQRDQSRQLKIAELRKELDIVQAKLDATNRRRETLAGNAGADTGGYRHQSAKARERNQEAYLQTALRGVELVKQRDDLMNRIAQLE